MIDRKGKPQSQAAFPVCIYDGNQDGYEINKEGYGNNPYCNMFQTTFNEHGMCYTYNNYELSLDKVGQIYWKCILQVHQLFFISNRLTQFKLVTAPFKLEECKDVEKRRDCK